MKFYNFRRAGESNCLCSSWSSDEKCILDDIEKRIQSGQNVVLEVCDMPEFIGTPALNKFSHWEYSNSQQAFALCLNRAMFPIHSRGILAEISMKPQISYIFSILAFYGLFGAVYHEADKATVVSTLEDALAAVERGISVHLKQLQKQLNALISSSQDVYI